MTNTSNPFSDGRNARARGTTLVEVVAGLALLATLLTSTLMAKARFSRQSRIADRRHDAVAAADGLLSGWWQDVRTFPRTASGSVGAGFSWSTRIIAGSGAEQLGGQVVRLEVDDARSAGAPAPLVSVDVVLPAAAPTVSPTITRQPIEAGGGGLP